MKRSKLFILSLATPMLLLGTLTSCNSTNVQVKHEDFIKDTNFEYLYDVTYNNYSWTDVNEWLNSNAPNNEGASFGCSSVHNGNFYGRSFDFCYTDMNEFLIRTKHENGHYASIGMAIGDCNVKDDNIQRITSGTPNEKDKLIEKILPFTMVDGINENGVVCNTNVVPAKDLPAHQGEPGYFTHGTNPGATDLFYQFMPRYILDNAKNAKHAVELLRQHNLTAMNKKGEKRDFLGVSKMGYELHCMIADRNDTFVVEMFNDEFKVIDVYSDVMTNYYLSTPTPSGAGLERYATLYDNYKKGETLEGMEWLIHEVMYSPCYNPNWAGAEQYRCPVWPTEFAGCDIIDPYEGEIKLTFYNAAEWFRNNWTADIKNALQTAYNIAYNKGTRATEPGGAVPWISTHAEVFDIDNRTLHLVTQEKEKDIGGGQKGYDFKSYKL